MNRWLIMCRLPMRWWGRFGQFDNATSGDDHVADDSSGTDGGWEQKIYSYIVPHDLPFPCWCGTELGYHDAWRCRGVQRFRHQGPLLVTWITFNPRKSNCIHYKVWDDKSMLVSFNTIMDKSSHEVWIVWWHYLSIPKPTRCNRWRLEMNK